MYTHTHTHTTNTVSRTQARTHARHRPRNQYETEAHGRNRAYILSDDAVAVRARHVRDKIHCRTHMHTHSHTHTARTLALVSPLMVRVRMRCSLSRVSNTELCFVGILFQPDTREARNHSERTQQITHTHTLEAYMQPTHSTHAHTHTARATLAASTAHTPKSTGKTGKRAHSKATTLLCSSQFALCLALRRLVAENTQTHTHTHARTHPLKQPAFSGLGPATGLSSLGSASHTADRCNKRDNNDRDDVGGGGRQRRRRRRQVIARHVLLHFTFGGERQSSGADTQSRRSNGDRLAWMQPYIRT